MSNETEQINVELKDHQTHVDSWDYRSLIQSLHTWSERFIVEFKLECSVPALRLDNLRSGCCGHFRTGRNGFGLLNEIAVNQKYVVADTVDFDLLGTVLHELIHSEQQILRTNGKVNKNHNFHNGAFIQRAAGFGLIVDRRGHQQYASPPTKFSELLARHGIEMPKSVDSKPIKSKSPDSIKGDSKLKLWVCSCNPPVRVRVAIADFQARCLKCAQIFIKA
jgi:hypothetical protein